MNRKNPPASKSPAPAKAKSPKPVKPSTAVKPQAKPKARPKPTPKTKTATASTQSRITAKNQRFIDEYMIDLNGTQAAIRAGYSKRSAAEVAFELLRKPQIKEAIRVARANQQDRTQITADAVLKEAWYHVTADAREITSLRIGCCRHCHGYQYRYQRTIGERDADYKKWESRDPETRGDFDEEGGIGFDSKALPDVNCPICAGDGVPHVVLRNTDTLSPASARLFAGVKQTKFGIEVVMHSKDAAMEKLFRHLGLYEKDNNQKTDPLSSLLHEIAQRSGNGFGVVGNDPEHDNE